MLIRGKLSKFDLFLLQEAFNEGHDIKARIGASHMVGTETVKVHSDGSREWYLFGGHCMWFALIQADSFGDAFEIYLEEFVAPDDPESESEMEYGYFDSTGNWYSESTIAYIVGLDIGRYDEWGIEITPAVQQ